MGIDHTSEIDKIISEMKIIIDTIKKNENKINKSIKYRIQGIYHDFLITQVPDKELLSEFYFIVGMGYQLLSGEENKKKALDFLQQAEELVDKEDIDKLYEIYNEMGIACYMMKKYERAHRYYNLAYQLALDHKLDINKISACLVNLSTVYTQRAEYISAINHLEEALELFEYGSVKSNKEESHEFIGEIHFNIAVNYFHLFKFKESLQYYKRGKQYKNYSIAFLVKVNKMIELILKDLDDEKLNEIQLLVDEFS